VSWIKRNLVLTIFIAVALCAVAALVAETAWRPGSFAPAASVASAASTASGDTAIPGAAAANTQEAVESWPEANALNSYELALVLDPDAKMLSGTMTFAYVNTEDGPMGELHFLLYANSYEKREYGIFAPDEMEEAYPNGFSPGSTAIKSVECSDGKATYLIEGEQNQVLRVHLPRAVPVGGTTRLTIEFEVTVPNCYGRFGYGDDTMSLVNCYPVLSVYDGGQWHDYPYYAVGDPFYSETADYSATVTAPEDWTVAATGVVGEADKGKEKIWTVDAPRRRDFGFVASDKFDVMQTTVDGVLVRSYYIEGSKSGGREALDTGAEAIDLYSKTFGQYPFAEFSVVEADFYIGGMEYPGMVMIDDSMYGENSVPDKMMLDLVVAHETGHQWWYSAVGNDEVMNPWLDEGLTEFTTQYFFEKERNRAYNDYYRYSIEYFKGIRGLQQGDYSVIQPVYRFEDNRIYSAWVYARTADVLQELRKKIGDEDFFGALRQYYEDNRLGITTRENMEKAFEDASGAELTQWFEQEFSASGN
jgi:hypothetical protein